MDLSRATARRIAVWGAIGLLGGGVAADLLWRQKSAQEQAALRTDHTQEMQRLADEVKDLTDQLAAERLRREAVERALSEGRK
ncbi:MAG TPA: hypothetical protein VKN16_05000 [Methylomirabilota bacterium]|nr:hypothetical protein [Methylomirabilota bacterium]